MTIKEQIETKQDELIALRRDFHAHPELSLREFRTAQRIEEALEHVGIEHRRIGETGVLGIVRGSQAGENIIALRADTDALPIQQVSDEPYCSQTDGVMHACGHDAHTACLLGAAQVLQANRVAFGGEIRLIFQAAEEIGEGAEPFLVAGALDGASRVLGLHVTPDLPVGVMGLKPGLNNAAVDHFRIEISGKSAHVSTPQLGADALYIASQIVVTLQSLVTRMTSPVEPVIIGVGTMSSGTSYNIIAPHAEMEGTTRTISAESRARVRMQVDAVAKQIATLFGGHAEVIWTDIASVLVNNENVCMEVSSLVESIWGEGHTCSARDISLGGDNYAEYLLRVPGAYVYLGTGNAEKPATLHALHNSKFDIDEAALVFGATLYAQYALWWLGQEGGMP